jgi:hypothetical protein
MTKAKYDNYFITQCASLKTERLKDASSGNFDMYKVRDIFPQSGITGSGVCFVRPFVMVENTHIHDCDEYLFFMGANFGDLNEFDAEIELHMGEEGEIHVIKSPTIVYIPAKLVHCPLKFVKVAKPVLFFHVRDH